MAGVTKRAYHLPQIVKRGQTKNRSISIYIKMNLVCSSPGGGFNDANAAIMLGLAITLNHFMI